MSYAGQTLVAVALGLVPAFGYQWPSAVGGAIGVPAPGARPTLRSSHALWGAGAACIVVGVLARSTWALAASIALSIVSGVRVTFQLGKVQRRCPGCGAVSWRNPFGPRWIVVLINRSTGAITPITFAKSYRKDTAQQFADRLNDEDGDPHKRWEVHPWTQFRGCRMPGDRHA